MLLENPPNPFTRGKMTFPFWKVRNHEIDPSEKLEIARFPLVKGVRGIFECKNQNCYPNRETCLKYVRVAGGGSNK